MFPSPELAPLVLTRPAAQQAAWCEALTALGVPVRGWPLIDIGPAPDPRAPSAAWRMLPSARLAFFASPNAVEAFMAARPPGQVWPTACWAACVGPGSADALRAAGVPPQRVLAPDVEAAQFDSEALWPLLMQVVQEWRGQPAMLLRGQGGREWLADRLRAQGAQVHAIAVYQRQCPQPDASALAQLRSWMGEAPAPLWLLSSSEAVTNWRALVGMPLPPLPVLATHPRIAQAAREAGLNVTEVAPTVAAVAEAWRSHVREPLRPERSAP